MVAYLQAHGYHPRSNKHGEALCNFVLNDLMSGCPGFSSLANRGDIVRSANFVVNPGAATEWDVDLVAGPPDSVALPTKGMGIARGTRREAGVWMPWVSS